LLIAEWKKSERSLNILKEPSQQTVQRILNEANDNIAKFKKSRLGLPFKKTMEADQINYVITSFTGAAYTGDGRTPKRWTAETVKNVISLYFPQFLVIDTDLLGQTVPLLVNYFTFLEHDQHYIKNSNALIKAAFVANSDLVAASMDPSDWPDGDIDDIVNGDLGEEFLNQTSPEELEQMKQAYTVLLQEQQQGTLAPEDEKMLQILDGVLSHEDDRTDQSHPKPKGHPQMKLVKKPRK